MQIFASSNLLFYDKIIHVVNSIVESLQQVISNVFNVIRAIILYCSYSLTAALSLWSTFRIFLNDTQPVKKTDVTLCCVKNVVMKQFRYLMSVLWLAG